MTRQDTRRDDIDGLRALAVLLVLLFHAQLNDLRGGFIGVDVFFVISGYLIVPMIVRAQAEGRFGFGAFLLRRLRRLVPAMVPVLIYTLVAAALLLGDARFGAFLHSLLGAAFYVSSHVFKRRPGISTPTRIRNCCCTPGRWRWSFSSIW